MEIDVDSPRPLAAAALMLEERFGRRVTYEDAPFVHGGDVVRDDGGRIIPRGGRLYVRYAAGDGLREILAECVKTHTRLGYPGVYGAEDREGDYHVVPRGFLDADGSMKERPPLLDTMISLPAQTRSGLQFVEDLVQTLSRITGETVKVGTLPTNALNQTQVAGNSSTGGAGTLLLSLLRAMGKCFSWQLLHDPGSTEFFLNIHTVSEQGKAVNE